MSLEEPYGQLVDTTLRLLSWNVWGQFGPWEERERLICDAISRANPDVVALQESWVSEDGSSQAERLGPLLGFPHVFSQSGSLMFDSWGPASAVLSRWPINNPAEVELTADEGARGWPGSAVSCVIDGPRGAVPLVNVALDWPPQSSALRQGSVRQVAELAKALGTGEDFPVVVCGDFNADPTSSEIRGLVGLDETALPGFVLFDVWEKAGEGPGITWDRNNPFAAPTLLPSRRIDYVLTGWPNPVGGAGDAVSATLVGDGENPPSDHYGVLTTLRY